MRSEVFNSLPLREFLELDKHCSDAVVNPPQLLVEIKGFLHSIRDFHISAEQSRLYVSYIRRYVRNQFGYQSFNKVRCLHDQHEDAMGK